MGKIRKNVLSLDGEWMLYGTDQAGRPICLKGIVPGCVHTDLLRQGVLRDPFYRDQSREVQWVEERDFSYTRQFEIEHLEENAFLEFDGLDTYCEIWLNKVKIARTENMFLRYAFPVDGILKQGMNELEVRFFSPIREVENMPARKGAFTTERMNTRRMQCTYGWDWTDRFVTMGIFRNVRLVFRRANEIEHVYAVTKYLAPYGAQIELSFWFRDFARRDEKVKMTILSPEGRIVWEKERVILEPKMQETVDIRQPRLWYPNGYGEQPLYTIKAKTDHSEKQIRFGIRQIVLFQPVDEEGSPEREKALKLKQYEGFREMDRNQVTSGFTVLVNGIPIMCKGANWVPCEPFPSEESPEKIEHILKLSVQAGVNMIRVWGGGIFERDEFYDLCDRLGILVTQDFLMACGTYPEEEAWFLEALRAEAKEAALRLRNHSCLAWWTGDNENAVFGNENRRDYPGYLSAAKGIGPVLKEFDPERRFIPSSPYGGDPFLSPTRGTTHMTSFLDQMFRYMLNRDFSDYREFFSAYLSRFNTEQPTLGMPFASSLRKFMTEEDIFGEDTSISEFHTKTNPGLEGMTIYKCVDQMTRRLFGEYESGEDRIRKMQMVQCEWIRISMELYRRNKWFSSGILYWMLNDCWPAANGWALIDYYGCPKPAYYLFKRCAKPVIASMEHRDGKFLVYVCNDSLIRVSGKGRLSVYDFVNDKVLKQEEFVFQVPENQSVPVQIYSDAEFEKELTEKSFLLCEIKTDAGEDRAFWLPKPYREMAFVYEDPQILAEDAETLTVLSRVCLPYAMLDVPYVLEDDCMLLKKGEIRNVRTGGRIR